MSQKQNRKKQTAYTYANKIAKKIVAFEKRFRYGSKILHKLLDLEKRVSKITMFTRPMMIGLFCGCVLVSGTLVSLCELLRLIEVGASCFNHYCVGYDVTQLNVLHNVHRRISLG